MGNVYFHVDLDAFFASVEILDHEEYRGKPIIIGTPGRRHVASTCSYEARGFGVHSAMPMTEALRLCPNAICIKPNMERYCAKSKEVMAIISAFAPGFLQVSIDEAFLDMSGMERIYPLPGVAAKELKAKILKETGLTVSIGVASSRYLAKLGSDYHKPDGLTIIPPGREEEFIDKIGIERLWGIGKSTLQALRNKGIYSTYSLRSYSNEALVSLFGNSTGSYLYKIVRGIDPGIYQGEVRSQSISTETTFTDDIYDMEIIRGYLLDASQQLMLRSLDEKKIAKGVGIKIRYGDFSTHTYQTTPNTPLYSSSDIYTLASELFDRHNENKGVRLLGVSLNNLYSGESIEQQDLFMEESKRKRNVERAILDLSKKGALVVKAGALSKGKGESS